ncbi:MAG: ABC transporter substrate-binding protein [Phycisphaerales bacterium]
MRWLLTGLVGLWALLSVFAYTVVRGEGGRDEALIAAYLVVASEQRSGAGPSGPDGGGVEGAASTDGAGGSDVVGSGVSGLSAGHDEFGRIIDAFLERASAIGVPGVGEPGSGVVEGSGQPDFTRGDLPRILDLPESERRVYQDAFRAAYREVTGRALSEAPVLVWSTDDNPARRVQTQLFREWHLRHYGTPVDIVTDPSNRDATKTIVQSTAGAGPDLIEAYGPAELRQFVDAGIALDVTERAQREGFGVETVFAAARSSIGVEEGSGIRDQGSGGEEKKASGTRHQASRGEEETQEALDSGWVQYGYPCNVGYTVLFYHRDVFAEAGIDVPSEAWTMGEAIEVARRLTETRGEGGRRRVGIMNIGAWDIALGAGGRFLNEDGTASIYNSAETIEAFRTYQAMMYEHRVMPSPAEAASMAASGGAAMNAGAEAASASALFAAKVTAMYVGGRWEYVSLAQRNRDRVIFPAIERRLAALAGDGSAAARTEAALLEGARASLRRDVLIPLSDEQFAAMEGVLDDEDRSRLIQLGVAHVPTLTGVPYYSAAARVAIVNRASPRAEYAQRFLRFLSSEAYNEQINRTFDSICGVPAYCFDADGIAGPPRPLPGLEAFDSPVFGEAMGTYAEAWRLSPFIGRNRLGMLAGQVMERLTNNEIGAAEAARLIEDRINAQIMANLVRDPALRARWEAMVGVELDPDVNLRVQVERARGERERVGVGGERVGAVLFGGSGQAFYFDRGVEIEKRGGLEAHPTGETKTPVGDRCHQEGVAA